MERPTTSRASTADQDRAASPGEGFFSALALATAAPLLVLPFYGLSHLPAPAPVLVGVGAIWVVTGFGHVMSTTWFGLDPGYKDVVRAHRPRMLFSLAAIPLFMAGAALADRSVSAWLYAGFLTWQGHHFARQNFGVLSFAAARDRTGPLPREVGWIIHATSAAGAIAMATMTSIYPPGLGALPFLAPAAVGYAHEASLACLVVAGVLAGWLVSRHAPLRRSPTVLLFLGLSVVFFAPALLSGPAQLTFWPYAMAHGAQYLVIAGMTARRSPYHWLGLAIFAGLAIGLGVLAFEMKTTVLRQAYAGIVMWHFLADARLWRLRDPLVRATVRRRFDFVFGPAAGPARPGPGVASEPAAVPQTAGGG